MTQNGDPIYSVKYYRDGVYKLVKFPGGLRMRLPKDGLLTDVWYDFQQLSFDDIDLAE